MYRLSGEIPLLDRRLFSPPSSGLHPIAKFYKEEATFVRMLLRLYQHLGSTLIFLFFSRTFRQIFDK